jgi:hypothetical protein
MKIDFADLRMQSIIERSNFEKSNRNWRRLLTQLSNACQPYPSAEALLDVSSVGLCRSADVTELRPVQALLVLSKFDIALVHDHGLFKRRTDVERMGYGEVAQAVADERCDTSISGEYSVQLLGIGSVPLFRLAWYWSESLLASNDAKGQQEAATERDRILITLQKGLRALPRAFLPTLPN